jgi:hypothetical protein
MITETSSTVVPPELFQTIETLQGNAEKLQRELAQALEVWQSTLTDDKNKFEELLGHKELAWQEQNGQWARQSQAYEERLAELKSEFDSRLKQTEQNAARALTELDDAWQRDKLAWGPAAQQEWPAQRRELEAKAQALEERLSAIESAHAAEREALQTRIWDLASRPEPAAGPTPETVKALQSQLLEFQGTVASLQDQASHSDELVNACVQALDYQISVLYDLVYHYAPPASAPDNPPDRAQP